MILFNNDWKKYPTAIPDYNTTNESYLEYCRKLKIMGVENHLFPLALYQPELSGLDPYSSDLTFEQKLMMGREIQWNFWYYAREVLRVPKPGSLDGGPLHANRANISMYWSFFNDVIYFLTLIRQAGKTVSALGLLQWLYIIKCEATQLTLITKDADLRTKNILELKAMRRMLPEWLVVNDKHDIDNTMALSYKTKGNYVRAFVAQNSEAEALKRGRGNTTEFSLVDEGPFIKYGQVMIPSALSAGTSARTVAREEGKPQGTIFTTTAGKLDEIEGKFFHDLMFGCVCWSERFLDLDNQKQLHEMIDKSKRGKMRGIYGVFNHTQVGKTDKWLYDTMAESAVSGEDADRDFFNRWTSGGIGSPLSTEVLERLRDSVIQPLDSDIDKEGYVLNWYCEREVINKIKSKPILIGADTSDAIGIDDISLVFNNPYDMTTLATAHINETFIPAAARWVARFLCEHDGAILIIEKKSSAQTFIDTAIDYLVAAGMDPFKKIFNRIVNDPTQFKEEFDLIRRTPVERRTLEFYQPFRKYFGFNTTGSTRHTLYSSVLKHATNNYSDVVYDNTLSSQIRGLKNRNGRIDHDVGGHDDAVIAWLLNNWFMMYNTNPSWYGIDMREVKVQIAKSGETGNHDEIKEIERLHRIRSIMEDLAEKLKNTSNPYLVYKLLGRLRNYEKEFEGTDIKPLSVSDIENELNSIKRNRFNGKMIA